jgi:hypothetical protein
MRNECIILVGKLQTRDSLGDLVILVGVNATKWIIMACVEMFLEDAGVDRRMILK